MRIAEFVPAERWLVRKRLCLTISPAVELSLQFLDVVLQGLVLLLLLLVFPLPLLCSQLQVDGGSVPDGLGTVTQVKMFFNGLKEGFVFDP